MKRNNILKEENTNKKIKLEMDKLNKTNNKCESNLPSPPKENNCTMKEYDLINNDNEKVAKILEYIFRNKNICIIDAIQNDLIDNINCVINTLYEKIENIKKRKFLKRNTERIIEYLDFLDLTSDERKLLIFFKFIFKYPTNYEQKNEIFNIIRKKK